VKKPTASVRASHLNTDTGIPEEELAWPETSGRVTRLPGLHLEVASRSTVTPYGGLALASAFLKRFRVAQEIDARVQVLKIHLPFFESDHVLAQALNLYAGGECLEDQAALQHDEGVLRMLGACRIPDPTTAGDFLRRFEERRNPGSLTGLRAANDAVQDAVWGKLAGKRKRKRDVAVVDLDGHTKALYGVQKEGADFDYKGRWSYNVLLASLAGSGECLAVRLRAGNERSSEGAADLLEETLPRVKRRFTQVLVRADSDFDRRDVREACEAEGAFFAFVAREASNRPAWAEAIPESACHRDRQARRAEPDFEPRRKKRNRRRRRARQRGYTDLKLVRQWVAEIPWTPPGSEKTYRMIRGGDRCHLPTLRPGERDRADGQRRRPVAHARRRIRGQWRVARDRTPGVEPRQVDRPARAPPGSRALGVEALPTRLRVPGRRGDPAQPSALAAIQPRPPFPSHAGGRARPAPDVRSGCQFFGVSNGAGEVSLQLAPFVYIVASTTKIDTTRYSSCAAFSPHCAERARIGHDPLRERLFQD
jgi:hypothetical protein